MGELLYEEREYPAGYWASVTQGEDLYEQSISIGFMKLMRFICKENSAGKAVRTRITPSHVSCDENDDCTMVILITFSIFIKYDFLRVITMHGSHPGRYLGMTVPVLSNVQLKEDGVTFQRDVQTSFFLPAEFQNNTLHPSDSDITIVHREPFRVVARSVSQSDRHDSTFVFKCL